MLGIAAGGRQSLVWVSCVEMPLRFVVVRPVLVSPAKIDLE